MSAETSPELTGRLARMRAPDTNGREASADRFPDTADLDWFLFQSFPDCAVPPSVFVPLVPLYERALRAGAKFDYELLFVRVLELHADVGTDRVHDIARAALERALAGGFEPADAIAALRLALRALPADDPFLDHVMESADADALRFHWTLDFVLDERGAEEYLALSYLRDDDPATADLLACFPVPPARATALGKFFAEAAAQARLEEGWTRHAHPDDRSDQEALAASVRERLPGFAP